MLFNITPFVVRFLASNPVQFRSDREAVTTGASPKHLRPGPEHEPWSAAQRHIVHRRPLGRAESGYARRGARFFAVLGISSSKVLASFRAGASKPSVNNK